MRLRDPTAVAIVGAIPFLVIASVGLFPKAYNRYVHAIGRMSSRVEVGDSCEEIPRKFEEYVRAHGTSQAD